jgi:signal peptidase I
MLTVLGGMELRVSRKTALRALDLGSNAVLALLLVAVLGALAAPHALGWKYGILRSGSMSPDMPAGSAIVVAPAGPGDVAAGDVITYRSAINPQLLVTHRVHALTVDDQGRRAFITKGDANEKADSDPVTADRLMGKVIFSAPGVGYVVQKLHSPLGFFFLLLLPTLLIIGMELRELSVGIRDMLRRRKGSGPDGPSDGPGSRRELEPHPTPGGGETAPVFIRLEAPRQSQRRDASPGNETSRRIILGLPLMTFAPGRLQRRLTLLLFLLLPVLVLGAFHVRDSRKSRKGGR